MFEELLIKLAEAFDGAEVPYMIVGGHALLLYGEPRLTKDIDVSVGLGIEASPTMVRLVGPLNLVPAVDPPDDFVARTMVLPLNNPPSGIRVDLMFSTSEYELHAIDRSVRKSLRGTDIHFSSLEDLIIHKVIAGRARDYEDVKGIVLKNPDHDKSYIDRWLTSFDTSLNTDYLKRFESLLTTL